MHSRLKRFSFLFFSFLFLSFFFLSFFYFVDGLVAKGNTTFFLGLINFDPWLTLWADGYISRHVWRWVFYILYLQIWRDLHTLSLLRDSTCNNQFACMIGVHTRKATWLTKLFGGLSDEKIRRYNNSPPYVLARWPPQQISLLNFLEPNANPNQNFKSVAIKEKKIVHEQIL